MGALAGRAALITGAGSGLGRASAKVFAREGARVVVADIQRETGEETVELVRGAGGEAIFVEADVSNSADVKAMVHTVVHTYGRLDCAMNNAVTRATWAPIGEIPDEEWSRAIATNLTGVFLAMKYEIRAMLQNGGGAIVNVASTAGLVGLPNNPSYVAAKHGVLGLTKAAAIEYGTLGIRTNAICPGAMLTPALIAFDEKEPGFIESLRQNAPIQRVADPTEMAEAAMWLCSDAASFVLGHSLSVDGGFVSQ